MPVFPISLFVDKTVYAKRAITGYAGDFKTPRYSFAAGSAIGKVFSYVLDHKNGQYYLMFYITNNDYINYIPTYVAIKSSDISVVGLDAAIKDYEQQQKDEKEKKERDEKGAFAFYIEKYVPVVLTIFAAGYIVPKLINRGNNGN